MAGVVAGLLTSAVIKIAGDKLSTVLAEQGNLAWNFSDGLEDMKDTKESVVAVLKDAEQQSIKKESVRLWLNRLKDAALDISDMMDDYQDCDTPRTEKVPELLLQPIAKQNWQCIFSSLPYYRATTTAEQELS